MIVPACQRLAGARQRLQRKLLTKLSSSVAVVSPSSSHIHTLHSSTSSNFFTTLTGTSITALFSPCRPSLSSITSISRRSFAKAAAKGKEKAPAIKAPAAKLVRTTSKPPHPSSIPHYPPHNPYIPHPHTTPSLAALHTEPPDYDVNDPVFRLQDPHQPPSMNDLRYTADKYNWIDWSRYRDFIHRSDIHFFDNEVKQVDQNFYPYTPPTADYELDEEEEAERAEQAANTRLSRLLPFSAFIDKGSTTRVTRFGKVRSAWAMLLAGDRNGTASFGIGKGEDFGQAMQRAERDLRNNLTFLPLIESRTILSETVGKFGVCEVHMKPLPRGGGMTAGIIPRLVFEAFGLHDISAKVYGRALPKHQIFAIWDGLSRQRSMREWTVGRGIRAHRMFERGVQQPRAPPRAVLEERAEAIHRKLQEAELILEDERDSEAAVSEPDEDEVNWAKEDEGVDEEDVEDRRIATLGQVGPDGRVIDMDDITDGNEATEIDKDRLNWGPWLYAPQYVPVLPGAKPVIPSPKPPSQYGIQRGKNMWKKK